MNLAQLRETQSQLKEQVESVPEPAAAQDGAEVSEG